MEKNGTNTSFLSISNIDQRSDAITNIRADNNRRSNESRMSHISHMTRMNGVFLDEQMKRELQQIIDTKMH